MPQPDIGTQQAQGVLSGCLLALVRKPPPATEEAAAADESAPDPAPA